MTRDDESLARETVAVTLLAATASIVAAIYYFHTQQILLYGDAVAHLNIARRVVDSMTPGPLQLGSPWLPLPHLLMVPFVIFNGWWKSGVAGSLPSMAFYVLAAVGIYRTIRIYATRLWATIGWFIFAANPNMLYMQSTAMTEPVYIALFVWVVYYLANAAKQRHQNPEDSAASLGRCGMVLLFAIMTRYDAWMLALPVLFGSAVLAFAATPPSREVRRAFVRVLLLTVLGPLLWMIYNASVFDDALYFMRGPYSAQAIEARSSHSGEAEHPGYHSLKVATQYFIKSAKTNVSAGRAGNWFLAFGLLGSFATLAFRRQIWPLWLLWLPIPFYAWSIAYGSVPLFVPMWWPFGWYNVRYGLELLPAFAVFIALAGGLLLPDRRRMTIAIALLLIVFLSASYALVWHKTPISLQEARVNSVDRVRYEKDVAVALHSVPRGSRMLMYLSDHVGAVQAAGIPFKNIVNEGNYLHWTWALAAPETQGVQYVLAASGDPVEKAMQGVDVCLYPVSASINDPGEPQTVLYRVGNRKKQQGCTE